MDLLSYSDKSKNTILLQKAESADVTQASEIKTKAINGVLKQVINQRKYITLGS